MTRIFISILLLVFVTAGCGGGGRPKDMPKLTPCEFVIQYEDGTPIDKATVMMLPVGSDTRWYANGSTDSSGVAKIATHGIYAGVAPGEYKITVRKQDVTYPPGYDPEKEDGPEAIFTNLIDQNFSIPDKTPLNVTVAGTPVTETFQVKKPK